MAYEPEIEKLERKYQDDPARHFAQLAEQYRRADRLDEALDILTRHLEERPNYVSGLIVLGRCYLDRRDDAAARETFERVLALDAEHIIALKALGDLADRAGDGPEAIRWLERLLEVDPMNEDAQASLERIKTEGPMGPMEEPAAEVADATAAADAAATEPAAEHTPEFSLPDARAPEPQPSALMETAPVTEPEPAPDPQAPEAVEMTSAADDELQLERATPAFEPSPEPVGQSLLDEAFGQAEPGDDLSDFPAEAMSGDAPASGLAEAAETTDVEEAESATTPPALEGADASGMELQSFDTELAWDTGDRTSQQISDEDLIAAEHLHSDDVEPVAHQLPGLETAFVPPVGDEAPGIDAVEGLSDVVPMGAAEPGDEAGAGESDAANEPDAAAAAGPPEAEPQAEAEVVGAAESARGEDEPEPPTTFELEAVAEVEEEVVVEETVDQRGSLTGLPLILPPEEVEAEAEPEPVAEAAAPSVPSDEEEPEQEQEPEPVVTETMAELYARQGLSSEAADVYRQLLRDRPGDPRLTARLQELERHERVSASSPGLSGRYRASETDGQSAREFLGQILAARPGDAATGPEAPAAPDTPAPSPAPTDDFNDQSVHPRGNPTQPASNDISLASAFGENPPEPPAQRPSGFSFDEFFGGAPPAAPPPASERPSHAVENDEEGDAAFRQWLKGLKS